MSKPAVEITDLGKRYFIKKQSKREADRLRELFMNKLTTRRDVKTHEEELWALKDLNFELREGETLGIIGRNGAGKSTLLKILSRIVSPTTGKIVIRGKTASLLEVGTGFHPELTGRENVFFNGSLLGMKKVEIQQNFNDIVGFSEIGKFIDTPVKHYSSGMRGRLAFSVAAHLDADIMIIDEVLSTGDVGFRKKALEKMKAAAFEGRSVLFVSHSMGSVQDLCDRTLFLREGKQVMIGDTEEVVREYLGSVEEQHGPSWKASKDDIINDERIIPKSMQLMVNGKSTKKMTVERTDTVGVKIELDIPKPTKSMSVGVTLFDEKGRRLYRTAQADMPEKDRPPLKPGINKLMVEFPTGYLRGGDYTVAMDADIYKDSWAITPMNTNARIMFSLLEDMDNLPHWDPKREAILKPRLEWKQL